jgi:hypothetical protein
MVEFTMAKPSDGISSSRVSEAPPLGSHHRTLFGSAVLLAYRCLAWISLRICTPLGRVLVQITNLRMRVTESDRSVR